MKTKKHKYYLGDTLVPGVTTIIRNLGWNTDALIGWARKVAMAGNDPNKIKEQAAEIGTIAHLLCECDARGEEADIKDYSPNDVEVAKKCYGGYLEWKNLHNITSISPEIPLVSKLGFGGTIDMVYKSGDKTMLGDIKTSNSVFPEHKIQVAAYYNLLIENNYKIDEVYLLHFSKNGEFAPYKMQNLDIYWKVFTHCLELHKLRKVIT